MLVPIAVYFISGFINLAAPLPQAAVLIAAMPTMVFGIIICERYQLDSELYAAAVTLSTVCSLVTLPIWFSFLS